MLGACDGCGVVMGDARLRRRRGTGTAESTRHERYANASSSPGTTATARRNVGESSTDDRAPVFRGFAFAKPMTPPSNAPVHHGLGSDDTGAFPSAAIRFRKILAAPGTPAGSCRNSASVL